MSEIKVLKKGDPQISANLLKELIDQVESDMADIHRRFNGFMVPAKRKLDQWKELERKLVR